MMNMPKSLLALIAGTVAATAAFAEEIAIPPEVAYPEGIAFDPVSRIAYVAGTRTGVIAKLDLSAGSGKALDTGFTSVIGDSAPGVLGMRLDGRQLVLAGGRTAKIFVADAATGRLTKTIATSAPGAALLNDLTVIGRTAYVTDSLRPILWTLDLSGPLPETATAWLSFEGTPLQYGPGANLNGIVATPDGKTLIVGQMAKGLLFTIDVASRKVTPIDLKGELVEGADGLVLKGDMLFVVRQPAAEIVTIRLSRNLSSGTVIKRTKPASLLWPATAALDGDALLIVNSQLNRRATDTAQRPFTLSRIALSELGVN